MSQSQQQPVQESLVFVTKSTDEELEYEELGIRSPDPSPLPALCGVPLKYISLVTLAVQNSLLTIIMHYSRVHIPPSQSYSAPTAVLLNELLKGAISLAIAFSRIDRSAPYAPDTPQLGIAPARFWHSSRVLMRIRRLGREVFSPDCWKLSIPAILYVIQNNLQYVAATNLEAATFQVSYQMKILTTAAFSVLLLRKQLSPSQWLALFFLAIGVGIVQIQTGASGTARAASSLLFQGASMNALKGFLAVVAACFTSGLAGVYFEMVLKNSQSDLWIRNVQLSAFSLLPALVPIILARHPGSSFLSSLFRNFGGWAWATVAIQVVGGLVTAMVIKYSDNILKGFATSLSIVISFLASVALFDFQITFTFILGSVVVLIATWLYNQPSRSNAPSRHGYTAVKN
ncbi:hypothetical protein ID866_6554 [Astraeus odoratus]|nr:hypothetical protein ID866_6554 [Astraeus odoratus]